MCKNILQVSFYCFFTAYSQIDTHFDPDSADNAKQWNRIHYETIRLVIVCNWNHFEMRLLNLRINFYLLRTFCPHLGSFCVVSSFTKLSII